MKPLRQKYNINPELKINKYKNQATLKEIRQHKRKIIKALGNYGINISDSEAEQIMWKPHLVVRLIGHWNDKIFRRSDENYRKTEVIYDYSQPLCFSAKDLLGARAFMAYSKYLENKGKKLDLNNTQQKLINHDVNELFLDCVKTANSQGDKLTREDIEKLIRKNMGDK